MLRARAVIAGLLVLASAASAARACRIPVFRYALERWQPERYELTVFRSGPLSAGERAALDALASSPANVRTTEVDVSRDLAAAPNDAQALWAARAGAAGQAGKAWAVLRFPDDDKDAPDLWAGPLDGAGAAGLLDSPARRRVAADLLRGQSAAFVLVESGDKARDDATAKLLAEELAGQEKTIQIVRPDPDAPGPQLQSELPLRVGFSVVRVSRDDPAERLLVRMLMRTLGGDAAAQPTTPMAFAVFGRGRALPPLSGRSLNALGVADTAQFVAGDCSCEIKDLNPGLDLLMAADWEKALAEGGSNGGAAGESSASAVPVVAGAAGAAGGAAGSGAERPPAGGPPVTAIAAGVTPAAGPARPLLWAGVGVAALLVVVTGTWAMKSSRRAPR